MGQSITVEARQLDGFCVFSTDRSITGQDGAGFASPDEAAAEATFPGTLASRLFDSDEAIDHVYIASNDVVVRRNADWDEAAVARTAQTISDLFRFYPDS
jgi:hypothetical protein